MTYLIVNMVIAYGIKDEENANYQRVLWVDGAQEFVYIFDLKKKNSFPEYVSYDEVIADIKSKNAAVVDSDPFTPPFFSKEAIEKHGKKMDHAYETIKGLVEPHQAMFDLFFPDTRGTKVKAAAEQHGTTPKEIYKRLRLYWVGGLSKYALFPKYYNCGLEGQEKKIHGPKRGRPNAIEIVTGIQHGINVTPEIGDKLFRGYKQFYLKRNKNPLTRAYHLTLQTYFAIDHRVGPNGEIIPILPPAEELPTLSQFKYIAQKRRDDETVLRKREGEHRFNLHHRPLIKSSDITEWAPGSLAQIDSTIGDVYLVSSRDRTRIIGRPVIYLIKDVFSRMTIGFSVSLEGPSWLGAALAIDSLLADKVALCHEYGITIKDGEWPCHYLPKAILADRAELLSGNAPLLVQKLGMEISNTAPYRPDWKAIVERHFRIINDEVIRWLPGTVYPKRERGDGDYRLDARLTLHELRHLLIVSILHFNNHTPLENYHRDEAMIADGVGLFPIDRWIWGMENRSGQLHIHDREFARFSLLPRRQASITPHGIKVEGLLYHAEHPDFKQKLFEVRQKGRESIEISYFPNKADYVYWQIADREEFVTCYLTDNHQVYSNKEWWEIEDEFARDKQQKLSDTTETNQSEAKFQAQINALLNRLPDGDRSNESKANRLRNIRENRREEREMEREKHGWELGGERENRIPRPEEEEQINADDYVAPPNYFEKLKQMQNEDTQDE